MPKFRLLIIACLTIVMTGCVVTQPVPEKSGRRLRSQELIVLELQSENAVIKKENRNLTKKINELNNKIRHADNESKKEITQYKQLLASLEQSYKKLQATRSLQVDGSAVPTERIAAEPEKELSLDVIFTPESSRAVTIHDTEKKTSRDNAPSESEKLKATPSLFKDPRVSPPVNSIKTNPIPSAKKRYDTAYGYYLRKNYAESIQSFLLYLRRYPHANYADNALFWLGMSYRSLNNTKTAEKYFREILTKYAHGKSSDGFKTADALFMLGKLYESKNIEKSNFYYRRVTTLYPDSVPSKIILRESTRQSSQN